MRFCDRLVHLSNKVAPKTKRESISVGLSQFFLRRGSGRCKQTFVDEYIYVIMISFPTKY